MEGHFDCALTPEKKVNTCSFSSTLCSADIQLLQSKPAGLLELTVTGPEELVCTAKNLQFPTMHVLKARCLHWFKEKPVYTSTLFSYGLYIAIATFIFNLHWKIILFQKVLQLLETISSVPSSLSNGLCLSFVLEHHTVLQCAIAPGIDRQFQASRCLPFPEFAPGFS